MVLSSKIGIFGRFERCPFGKDRHFQVIFACVKNFLELSCKLSIIELFPQLLVATTASPARALTASLLDYVVEEVSTASYRARASRSTSDFRLNRPVDWSGWSMPALEVIRYELFLTATC